MPKSNKTDLEKFLTELEMGGGSGGEGKSDYKDCFRSQKNLVLYFSFKQNYFYRKRNFEEQQKDSDFLTNVNITTTTNESNMGFKTKYYMKVTSNKKSPFQI